MAGRTSRRWGPARYRITVRLPVPLPFAFRWCTDFSSEDPSLESGSYVRKILVRTPRLVVLEDLEDTKDGWIWTREEVRLHPPNRWHMDGVGNHRDVTADYVLRALPGGRTELELRWRRRHKTAAAARLTKAQREAGARRAWKRFAAAMGRDYARSRRSRRP